MRPRTRPRRAAAASVLRLTARRRQAAWANPQAADRTSFARLRLGLRALQHSTRFSLSEAVQTTIAAGCGLVGLELISRPAGRATAHRRRQLRLCACSARFTSEPNEVSGR